MRTATIIGAYNTGNMGDELMLYWLASELVVHHNIERIYVACAESYAISNTNWGWYPKFNIQTTQLHNVDPAITSKIVIWGGGALAPTHGGNILYTAALHNRPIVGMGIQISAGHMHTERVAAASIGMLKMFDAIAVRNADSQLLLAEAGIYKSETTCDLALDLFRPLAEIKPNKEMIIVLREVDSSALNKMRELIKALRIKYPNATLLYQGPPACFMQYMDLGAIDHNRIDSLGQMNMIADHKNIISLGRLHAFLIGIGAQRRITSLASAVPSTRGKITTMANHYGLQKNIMGFDEPNEHLIDKMSAVLANYNPIDASESIQKGTERNRDILRVALSNM